MTIPAGRRRATFSVPTVADIVAEGSETFSVRLSDPVNANIKAGADTGTGTITDANLSDISINSVGVVEGETARFTLTLSEAQGVTATVLATTEDGTAKQPRDYRRRSRRVTIPAGDTSATFEVRTIEDKVQEGNESFKVRLSSPHNAVIKKSVGYGGIEDDDMPELRLGNAIAEEGQPMIFDLSIVPASNTAFTLNYFTQDKTARAGMDCVAIDAESITIDAGVTAKQITVQTLDDLIDEPNEEFRLLVTLPRTVTVIGTGTIFNEDTPPTLTIADASANEGDALVFPVSLSGVSGYPVSVDWEVTPATATPGEDYVAAGGTFYPISVDWALTPGTATAGQDYVAATGTLSIPAGAGGGVIEVVTLQDLLDELDETLTLVMSAPQQVRLGEAARALGTIVDDDAAPLLRVEDEDGGVVVVAEEGQALVFTLRLSAPSARTISVDWTIEPGTATVGEDYLATSGAVMLAPGETMTRVEVMTLDDQKLEEAQETVLLTLLNPVNVALEGSATGYIADNDAANVQRLAQTNEAILPQVSAALLRERIDQVADCLGGDAPARSVEASLGSLLQRLPASSAELQRDERSWWERLGGTRFTTRLKPDEAAAGEEADGGYDITVCGGLAWRRLGDARRGLDWDGALYDAHLGGYLRLSETDRLGLNVSQSYVSLDYEDRDHAVQGDWELSLTGVQPYFSRQWEDGRSVWAMAGWGTGELTLTEAELRQAADAAAWQAALGGVLPLQWGQDSLGGWQRSLRVKGDVWWGRLELDGNESLLQSLSSSTVGGRALLESVHGRELNSGAHLSLETGAGLRYDDGAGDAGLEWTGGLDYRSAGRRFAANLDARALLLRGHTKEWGFSAQARLTPRVDGSGWSFAVAPGWGQTNSMAETLWAGGWNSAQTGMGRSVPRAGMEPGLSVSDTGMTGLSRGADRAGVTLNAELGYGIRLPWQQGLLTPYSAFKSDTGGEQVQMGLRWALQPGLRLELDAEYQPGNGREQGDAGLFLRYVIGR